MSDKQIAQITVPQDLPSRMVSLARVLTRLPDGEYTVELIKTPQRVQAQIVQTVPVKQVEFDQDDRNKGVG